MYYIIYKIRRHYMKLLAFYLPQFHTTPENDLWWGKGFTEWNTVRNARALFQKHNQPRIPYNDNYYCLDNYKTLRWQANIAKKNGIDAFCFYHYWFNGRKILEKPVEAFLKNKNRSNPYPCFIYLKLFALNHERLGLRI